VTCAASSRIQVVTRMTQNDDVFSQELFRGLVSFLSPCVLPLVPGYISMLSGIGMELAPPGRGSQLPACSLPRSAFVAGFFCRLISFGASASAVGSSFSRTAVPRSRRRSLILPLAFHLIGALIKLNLRIGIIFGVSRRPKYRAFLHRTHCSAGLGVFIFSRFADGFSVRPSLAVSIAMSSLRTKLRSPESGAASSLASHSLSVGILYRPDLSAVLQFCLATDRLPGASCSSPLLRRPRIPFLLTALGSANSCFTKLSKILHADRTLTARFAFVRRGDWSASTN